MIRFFTQHRTAANLLMIMIFILGTMSTLAMIRETLPEFAPEKVMVQVIYKGASPREVEDSICTLVEEKLEGIDGIERMNSKASEGIGQITLEMKEGYDLSRFYQDIKNEIDQINSFPEDAETPLVFIVKKKDPVITLAVTGDLPFRHLKEFGKDLRKKLLKNQAISLVDLEGVSQIQVKIKIKENTLRSLGLSLPLVRETILKQSKNLPLGTIENRDREILIRMMDQRTSPQAFGNLVIFSAEKGAQIRLSDIAEIKWDLEKKEEAVFLNGKKAVTLAIQKSPGEDALVIEREVKKFARDQGKFLPKGIELHTIENVAAVVQDRLTLLIKNAFQGFILVFFTLWLFLNIRMAFWVAMGIPFSFMGALWLMELYGLTLNMITMVSLLLGLGLIVDDAIVIGENIYTHHQSGKTPFQACIDGVTEVFSGVVCSFLTTVAAFLPLIFMKGNMGKVLGVLPIGVILALFISLIEAFMVLPNHLSHSLEKQKKSYWFRRKIEGAIQFFILRIFGPTVNFCLRRRYFITACVVGIFLIALGLLAGKRVSFIPFPDLDGDVVICYVLLPSGTPMERTLETAKRIERALLEVNRELTPLQPGKRPLVKCVKIRLGANGDAAETGSHAVTISAELLTSELRTCTSDDLVLLWRKKVRTLPDMISLKFGEPMVGPQGKAFEVEFKNSDLTMLGKASREFRQKLLSYNGVYNVSDNLNPGKWEARITTLPQAKNFGFTSRDISSQLSASFFGAKAQDFQLGSENIEVRVQFSDRDRNSLKNIEDFYLMDPKGKEVPLSHVARIRLERSYSNIYHVEGQRTVTITADVDMKRANASAILGALKKDYLPSLLKKYPNLEVDYSGQSRETAKTIPSARKGFILGLVGIFVILSFVFGSYLQPITIMVAIPFGLVGAVFGHYFMGLSMSMPSIVGFVSLSGIVVNDSIVLIQFMNDHLKSGMSPPEAAIQASIARFRPVFLTSATTVAGLLPLLLEKSFQAQLLIPLATSISFGLIFSTVLILLFIPCLTAIFYDFGLLKESAHEEKGEI